MRLQESLGEGWPSPWAWFWLNIPLAALFFCCWAGIPLWLTLTRWNAELAAANAELAAGAVPEPVLARPAAARETAAPAYTQVADLRGR
jgi:hypothetical protein